MKNQRESTRGLEIRRKSARILWRVDASPTLCIPIYSSISESIGLFVIYSNIRVAQNHHQSLQIIKNYSILSNPFKSEQSLDMTRSRTRKAKVQHKKMKHKTIKKHAEHHITLKEPLWELVHAHGRPEWLPRIMNGNL